MIGIYGIKNIQNNKWYVGQSVNIRKRINDHFSALRSNVHKNKHLQSAYNKYGEHAFNACVLEECLRSDLEKCEINWIKKKAAYTNGYNKTTGGEGVHNWVANSEYRKKISEKYSGKGNPFYGRKHSIESRKKMSESHRGEKHNFYGTHLSEKTRKKN